MIINKIFIFFRIQIHTFLVKKSIKLNSDYKISHFQFKSFNGRTASFIFNDKKNNQKFFLKKFIHKDKGHLEIEITDIVKKKYDFLYKLKKENLISYNFYKLDNLNNFYLRDYIDGYTLLSYFQRSDDKNFKIIISNTLEYINKIIFLMRKNNLFYSLDLHLENFIIDNNEQINIIDLDLVYINLETKNYEINLITKFFLKSIQFLNSSQKNIIFEMINTKFSDKFDFKKILLSNFFTEENNHYLNEYIFSNYRYFNNYKISFNRDITIKNKLISTLKSLPRNSYVVARRYDWLIDNYSYQTKDIDIFYDTKYDLIIRELFYKHGWDVNDTSISQYFEINNILVNIDLRSDSKIKFNISFYDLLKNVDRELDINVISRDHYYKIMLYNFLFFKKYIASKIFLEIKNYYSSNNLPPDCTSNFSINKSYNEFKDTTYSSNWFLLRKIIGNFINFQEIVFIGADGAGKSTISSIISDNLSLYVSTKKKYFSGFFYPSGRTNLFFFKTSKIFLILKFLKDKLNFKSKKKFNLESNQDNKLRTSKNLNLFYIQLILIICSPIFILDSWIHKFINRFSLTRLNICDRYYDDILINFTNPFFRKLLRYLIPKSKNKFYLYAKPEEHFNRKNNEDIEMIIHMQKCYTDNVQLLKKFPTNINQSLIIKKILRMVLKTL